MYAPHGQAAYLGWAEQTGAEGEWENLTPMAQNGWMAAAQNVLETFGPDAETPTDYVAVIERPWIPKVLIHGEEMEMLHPLQMTSEQRQKIDRFGQTYAVLRETPADQITDSLTQKAYADCGSMLQIFVPKLSGGHLKLMDLTDRYALIHACFIAYDRIVAERTNRVEAATE